MSLVSNAAAEPRNLFQDFGSKRKPTVSDEERRLSKDFRQVIPQEPNSFVKAESACQGHTG